MPQRLLRPQIRQSERWNRLSFFEQSLYIRLLTLVDDFGRYEAHPILLAHEAFPFGQPDGKPVPPEMISSALQTFENKCCQMLSRYQSDGKDFLQLTRWKERPRSDSKFPQPDNKCPQMLSSPPSPSPSPSTTPSPSPSTTPSPSKFPEPTKDELLIKCEAQQFEAKRPVLSLVGGGGVVEGVGEIESADECVKKTMNAGIPEKFTRYVHADWAVRSGKDASGVVVSFLPYVTKRWAREQVEWKNGKHKGTAADASKNDIVGGRF